MAFTPTAIGSFSAILTIYSSDCTNPLYSFAITASVSAASALNFTGAGEFINLPGTAPVPTGNNPYTIEAWIKPNNFGDYGIIGWGNYGVANQVNAFRMGNGGVLINYWWGNDLPASVPTLTNGAWHHVAATYDGITRAIYVDGLLAANDNPTGLSVPSNANLKIGVTCPVGCSGGPEYFNGSIDEVRVWNVGRSQCQIQQYMNCEIPSTTSGLVLNYHFNQGIPSGPNAGVTTLTDAAGGNDGTLNNFVLNGPSSNWTSPGGVISGFTTVSIPTASLIILGNGATIPNGSTATSTNNFTDFGTALTRTFVAQNSAGSGTLSLNSVILSGANASEFSYTTTSPGTLTAGATSSCIITFSPASLGTKTAIVTINSSDCSSPNYSFFITATSVPGAALNFDGLDDFAGGPILTTSTSNITMQAKIFWAGTNGVSQMICYNGNSGNSGYGIYNSINSNTLSFLFGGISFYPFNYTLTPNQWTSLSLVLKNSIAECYANGVLTNTVAVAVPGVPTNSFVVGNNNIASEPFNGSIDEVLLWDRALSQCEIQSYLNCEIATSSSSLLANYHFNQGVAAGTNTTVSILTDVSGNGHDLDLMNFNRTGITSNWVSPGAVISGSSCPAYTAPEIDLIGNGISITDGNTTASPTNNTDFGSVCGNSLIAKTFTIQNTGSSALTVSTLSMSGINASQFTISALSPASPIATGNFAVFSVTFLPGTPGIKTATINITNNDCDESAYDFVLTGTSNAIPTVTASVTNSVVCNGIPITLNGSGADTYTWSPTVTNAVSFTPTANQIYTVTGTYTLTGCTSTNLATQAITVNPIPAVAISAPSTTLCSGNTVTLIASGAGTGGTYTWSPGPTMASSITPSPSSNTTYTLVGTSTAGCTSTNTSVQTITVYTTPTITATSSNTMVCSGNSVNLSVGNANTYSWNPGSLSGSTIAITPLNTISYTAFGYNTNGCISSNSIVLTVTVNALPTVSATTTSSSVCDGFTTSLTGTGADTFTWSGNITNGVSFTPTATLTYTVNGTYTLTGCTNTNVATQTIIVNTTPTVSISASNSIICAGSNATLIGGGASSYTWNPGGNPGIVLTVSPLNNTTYTVIGTNTAGCTSTNVAIQTISVNTLPTVTANISNTLICTGGTISVNGSGAVSYTWTGGAVDGVAFAPNASATYSLTGTDNAGCTSTNAAFVSVTVNTVAPLSINITNSVICLGDQTTLNASGASTYTWTSGVINTIAFSPTITTTYSVTGSDNSGCLSYAVTTITVN